MDDGDDLRPESDRGPHPAGVSQAGSSPVGPSVAPTVRARTSVDAPARQSWHRPYRHAVLVVDGAALLASVAVAEFLRFGVPQSEGSSSSLTYVTLGIVIALGWSAALQLDGATDIRILGHGPTEYRRVVHASVMAFGLLAIISLLFKIDLSRGYLAIAFPLGTFLLLLGRKLLRSGLAKQRRSGSMTTNVLVIGGVRSAASIEEHLARHRSAGLKVTGVWVADAKDDDAIGVVVEGQRVPVMSRELNLQDALDRTEAGTVIVTDTEHLGPHGLRELTWRLQGSGIDLMLSPNVMDVSTPRVQVQSIGNMPFLHVEEPTFEGAGRLGKAVFDRVFALTALVVLSPIFLLAAIGIKIGSPGPVLYKSERIGVGGKPFQMLKFRTMVVAADTLRHELHSDVDGLLFKIKDDPRVTSVGRFLRRYSIDELPQLINVLRGDMSVVGPRPPLPEEVAEYNALTDRRLLVKQGITGLWQVSGRSDLSWEESVRLDLDYVENWSLIRDIHIVWRTIRAVVSKDGAY